MPELPPFLPAPPRTPLRAEKRRAAPPLLHERAGNPSEVTVNAVQPGHSPAGRSGDGGGSSGGPGADGRRGR
jgi:hypothetical protein